MPSYPCRPYGHIVNTDEAVRHWAERPGSATRPGGSVLAALRHETLYESHQGVFYVLSTYSDPVPFHPAPEPWARRIDFTEVCAWLRDHRHPCPPDFLNRVSRPW